MQSVTYDGFFFTPGSEDDELELSFFDYKDEKLKNAEKLKSNVQKIDQALYSGSSSALEKLNQAETMNEELKSLLIGDKGFGKTRKTRK